MDDLEDITERAESLRNLWNKYTPSPDREVQDDRRFFFSFLDSLLDELRRVKEALERIANAPASLDEGRIMRTIALNALQPQTEKTEPSMFEQGIRDAAAILAQPSQTEKED